MRDNVRPQGNYLRPVALSRLIHIFGMEKGHNPTNQRLRDYLECYQDPLGFAPDLYTARAHQTFAVTFGQ